VGLRSPGDHTDAETAIRKVGQDPVRLAKPEPASKRATTSFWRRLIAPLEVRPRQSLTN
jgi:hypothetical protein